MIEIQWRLEGWRERWVMERRFGGHLAHTCPASYIDLVWDQILTACPGRSWRMVQLLPGGGVIIHHGPTKPTPDGRQGPAPGREMPLPSLRFEQFGAQADG